ncbi:hypothetical protein SAMN05421833_12464 [Microbispora rosea]|uniref:Uncharacterized protein n=1 Tax=Microbispora rosea TaxID=58117 RepID=A0A1N7FVW9_9ACTN|nr:hypothetical protein SAMN05421833_12464 [Microbispora rosea]
MTGRCCDDTSCRSAARTAPQPRESSQVTVPATRARALRTAAGLESALHGGECRGRRRVSRGDPPPPPRGRPARFCFTGMTCGFPARREPALTGRLSGSTLWESALLPAFRICAEERPPFLHRTPGTFPALPAGRWRTAPARPRRPVRRDFDASVGDSPTETRTNAGGSELPQSAHRASAQQGKTPTRTGARRDRLTAVPRRHRISGRWRNARRRRARSRETAADADCAVFTIQSCTVS